jgi:hypothetical protein
MPKLIATDVCDHIFDQLQVAHAGTTADVGRPMFAIDGTTLRLQHRPELVKAFPPGRNQHAENHWPTMLLVVFHDVHTGLAMRPRWGKQAVGEQALAREALQRLPIDAIVLADGDLGIFAFAYALEHTQRSMIFRLTAARTQKVLGGVSLSHGREGDPDGHLCLQRGAGCSVPIRLRRRPDTAPVEFFRRPRCSHGCLALPPARLHPGRISRRSAAPRGRAEQTARAHASTFVSTRNPGTRRALSFRHSPAKEVRP